MSNHFFMFVDFTEAEDKQDYGYWFKLMEYYLKLADSIDFHIWNEEIDVIQELEVKTRLQKKRFSTVSDDGFCWRNHI